MGDMRFCEKLENFNLNLLFGLLGSHTEKLHFFIWVKEMFLLIYELICFFMLEQSFLCCLSVVKSFVKKILFLTFEIKVYCFEKNDL